MLLWYCTFYSIPQFHRKIVQAKIEEIQNPSDCNQVRILICQSKNSSNRRNTKLLADCGFGCLINHLLMCFFNAFASKRMLIYNENDFGVKSFQPYSKTCNFLTSNLPTTDSLFPRGLIIYFFDGRSPSKNTFNRQSFFLNLAALPY